VVEAKKRITHCHEGALRMQRKTILVVDDNEDISDVVATALQLNGCNAVTARNGAEAVELAMKCRPDLILMDLSMPVMNGYEATRRILAVPELAGVRIIAMSAHCLGNWGEQALQAGCVECLAKPILPGSLEELIQRYLGPCS
jgi:two-component system cell cycle response regulator DivK